MRGEMRVFGMFYQSLDVYIKIRVDLINCDNHIGRSKIFVMSFHFSEIPFSNRTFPYRNKEKLTIINQEEKQRNFEKML